MNDPFEAHGRLKEGCNQLDAERFLDCVEILCGALRITRADARDKVALWTPEQQTDFIALHEGWAKQVRDFPTAAIQPAQLGDPPPERPLTSSRTGKVRQPQGE